MAKIIRTQKVTVLAASLVVFTTVMQCKVARDYGVMRSPRAKPG